MRKLSVVLALAVLTVVTSLGCIPMGGTAGADASAPIPLALAADQNPDVIWMVRQVVVDDQAFYGLYACYRSEAPAPPKCFVASMAGDMEALSWPGNVELVNGVIRPARARAERETHVSDGLE